MSEEKVKGKRGLASMSLDKRREVAHAGGKAAHAKGQAHQWTPEEAQKAGQIGGTISRRGPRHTEYQEGEE